MRLNIRFILLILVVLAIALSLSACSNTSASPEIVVEEIRREKVWLTLGDEAHKLRTDRDKKAAKELPEPTEEEAPPAPPIR